MGKADKLESAHCKPSLLMTEDSLDVSVIIPALNEAQNLPELLRRIHAAMTDRRYEVLVIDDNSGDGTTEVCIELAQKYPLILHVRPAPTDGLSGAVLQGMSVARGEVLAVMDADLQHPPERLPELIDLVKSGDAEFALGSRYVAGGSTAEKWGPLRKLNSRIATILARPFAGATRDPMSGFFALRRETYLRGKNLTPLGYKIGLELMCKCRVRSVHEAPIHFDARAHGKSKLTLGQQFKYLEHLSRLYDFFYPRASPILKFLIVTGLSWFIALAVYLALVQVGASRLLAPVAAYPVAIATVAIFHARYVRTQRAFLVTRHPWRAFLIISLVEWVTCAAVAAWVASRVFHATVLEVFLLSFGAATFVLYVLRKEFLLDIRGLRRDPRCESP
jgi:dolichol-phosphate mannosyltransferase